MEQIVLGRDVGLARQGGVTRDASSGVGWGLVRNGRGIGEGLHKIAGGRHAEAEALASATESVVGATAYVTLEPCSYHGRTPSSADALIKAGVTRVSAATRSSHPQNIETVC